ncbi:MAG: hypothetical protein ACRCZG_00410 [Culicoidibacterales bacterium]
MMFFVVFTSIMLILFIIILRQCYFDMIYPKYISPDSSFAGLGEKIYLTCHENRDAVGFFQCTTHQILDNHSHVMILIPDHLHHPSQLFPLVQYFNNLGFDTFVYRPINQTKSKDFGFGHLDFEGADCLAFMQWYQAENSSKLCHFSGFGIGAGATTFIQLTKVSTLFDFLILEHLPIDFFNPLEHRLQTSISHFWLRMSITKILSFWFKVRHTLDVRELSNLIPCDIPVLLFNSTQHPAILASDTYRFLPYYSNIRAFDFSTNYLDSAIYTEPERYFFLIDTFLTELNLEK